MNSHAVNNYYMIKFIIVLYENRAHVTLRNYYAIAPLAPKIWVQAKYVVRSLFTQQIYLFIQFDTFVNDLVSPYNLSENYFTNLRKCTHTYVCISSIRGIVKHIATSRNEIKLSHIEASLNSYNLNIKHECPLSVYLRRHAIYSVQSVQII